MIISYLIIKEKGYKEYYENGQIKIIHNYKNSNLEG